jgi:putative ABC transport system substrate-binding protein
MRLLSVGLLAGTLPLAALDAGAQQARIDRVGVLFLGGTYSRAIDGLRDGLRELGFEEGTHFVLHIRDTMGDLKSVEMAASGLEAEKVDLIYTVATSVTLAAKRATKSVPIVFYAGADPVASGLVESFPKPGGRLTGIHGLFSDLTPKRLHLLKEILPKMRRVVTFYSPENPAAQRSIIIARDAARRLNLELVERPVTSVADLRTALRGLRIGEMDAFCYVADAMVNSQSQLVIDTARVKRLPTMVSAPETVTMGALVAYGVSYHAFGGLSAKHVQRVLVGANPGELPVEQVDRLYFAINLKTAKALGVTVPPSVLARADEVIR